MAKTRIGIYGYGNLGRGVELACRQIQEGYRKRELLPVEKKLIREMEARLAKR